LEETKYELKHLIKKVIEKEKSKKEGEIKYNYYQKYSYFSFKKIKNN